MQLIKNLTPYLGKTKLKFEKFPDYTGGSPYSLFNKVHLDLGFIKLVSRVYPGYSKTSGRIIDPEKIKLIEQYTGGKIQNFEWWCVKAKDGTIHESTTKPEVDAQTTFHGELPNSFTTVDGKYIGDIATGWWYYMSKMKVYQPHPHGVGEVFETTDDGNIIIGYYGYTHRGGQLFKIGDKLFESDYIPTIKDFSSEDWKKYNRDRSNSEKEQKSLGYLENNEKIELSDVIPYTKRGSKVIKTLEEAVQAAINIREHLS